MLLQPKYNLSDMKTSEYTEDITFQNIVNTLTPRIIYAANAEMINAFSQCVVNFSPISINISDYWNKEADYASFLNTKIPTPDKDIYKTFETVVPPLGPDNEPFMTLIDPNQVIHDNFLVPNEGEDYINYQPNIDYGFHISATIGLQDKLAYIFMHNVYAVASTVKHDTNFKTRVQYILNKVNIDTGVMLDINNLFTEDRYIINGEWVTSKGKDTALIYAAQQAVDSGVQPYFLNNVFKFKITNESTFEYRVEGSIFSSVFEYFVMPLAHPIGYTHDYRYICEPDGDYDYDNSGYQNGLIDFVLSAKEETLATLTVRCLCTSSEDPCGVADIEEYCIEHNPPIYNNPGDLLDIFKIESDGVMVTVTNSMDNGYVVGDYIRINNTTEYNGMYVIQTIENSYTFTLFNTTGTDYTEYVGTSQSNQSDEVFDCAANSVGQYGRWFVIASNTEEVWNSVTDVNILDYLDDGIVRGGDYDGWIYTSYKFKNGNHLTKFFRHQDTQLAEKVVIEYWFEGGLTLHSRWNDGWQADIAVDNYQYIYASTLRDSIEITQGTSCILPFGFEDNPAIIANNYIAKIGPNPDCVIPEDYVYNPTNCAAWRCTEDDRPNIFNAGMGNYGTSVVNNVIDPLNLAGVFLGTVNKIHKAFNFRAIIKPLSIETLNAFFGFEDNPAKVQADYISGKGPNPDDVIPICWDYNPSNWDDETCVYIKPQSNLGFANYGDNVVGASPIGIDPYSKAGELRDAYGNFYVVIKPIWIDTSWFGFEDDPDKAIYAHNSNVGPNPADVIHTNYTYDACSYNANLGMANYGDSVTDAEVEGLDPYTKAGLLKD